MEPNTTTEQEFAPCWAVVEIFGHQRYAGQVSEQPIAGDKLVRVDVPAIPESRQQAMSRWHPHNGSAAPRGQVWRYIKVIPAVSGYAKLFGVKALYALTPTAEASVRAMLAKERQQQADAACEEIECIPDPALLNAIAAPTEPIADAPDVDFDMDSGAEEYDEEEEDDDEEDGDAF